MHECLVALRIVHRHHSLCLVPYDQYHAEASVHSSPALSVILSYTFRLSSPFMAVKLDQRLPSESTLNGSGVMLYPFALKQSEAGWSLRVASVTRRIMISRRPSVNRPICPGKSFRKNCSLCVSPSSRSGRPSNSVANHAVFVRLHPACFRQHDREKHRGCASRMKIVSPFNLRDALTRTRRTTSEYKGDPCPGRVHPCRTVKQTALR